jgi:hypothetical protein
MECAADNRSAKKSTNNLVIPPNTWRPGEGYPDTAHPFHRRAIEHQDKILDYLIDLLKLFAIDKRARRRRGYFASSMAPSPRECSMALRRRFRFCHPPRQSSRAFRAREINAADDWLSVLIPSQQFNSGPGSIALNFQLWESYGPCNSRPHKPLPCGAFVACLNSK